MKYLSIAVALATLLAAPAAKANERIVFNCFFPPQHYACTQWVPEIKRRIEEATEKRVRVNIPPKSLSAPPDQYDGVVGGVMDGALQFNPFLSNQVPGIQFSLLPFSGAAGSEAVNPALWNTYQKFFADKNEYGDAVLISVTSTNGSELFSLTDEPILSVEDIRNRKMWALPGVVANTMKEAGSSVVAGPAVQMLEIISKGVVDGFAGIAFSEVAGLQLIDYTKSATITEGKLFQPTFSVLISRAKWDNISSEDQDAIMAVMGADFAQWAGAIQDGINAASRDKAVSGGVEIVEGPSELEDGLRKHSQSMVEAWVEQISALGVDGREVLDFYRSEIDRNRSTLGN